MLNVAKTTTNIDCLVLFNVFQIDHNGKFFPHFLNAQYR